MKPQNRPPRSARNVRRAASRPSLGERYSTARQIRAGRNRRRRTQTGSSLQMVGARLPKIKVELSVSLWRAAAVAVAALIVVVGFLSLTAVKTITVKGQRALETEHVTKLAQESLNKQWFGGSLPFVNTGAVKDALLDGDAAIKTAKVSRRLPGTVQIEITERAPSLNWKSGAERYVIDSDGTAIGPTPPAYEGLPMVQDNSALPVKAGERVVPTSFVSFTTDIIAQLKGAGIGVKAMAVPQTTTELYVTTDKKYVLKFDTTRPAADQFGDLQKVLAQLNTLKKTPQEYIDLRVENKAYYR